MPESRELIAEARQYVGLDIYPGAQLILELATALEVAETDLEVAREELTRQFIANQHWCCEDAS